MASPSANVSVVPRGGGQAERTRLAVDRRVNDHIGVLRERRVRLCRHGYQRDAMAFHIRQDAQQFVTLAGLGDRKDDVVGRHHPQIAMSGLSWMHKNCWRARA